MEEDYAIDVDICGTKEAFNQKPTERDQKHPDDSQIVKDEMDIESTDGDNLEKGSRKRKKKTSKVWEEFDEVTLKDGTKKLNCKYCNAKLSQNKDGSTSHLIRHMKGCGIRLASIFGYTQKVLSFPVLEADGNVGNVNYFKYDKEKIRDLLVKMFCVHEYPFCMVEHGLFLVLMKSLNPRFEPISRNTLKNDCMKMYALQKKKIRHIFTTVDCISLTCDCWTSNQNIGYMCVTTHYLDSNWILQKKVINFLHLVPPHIGLVISDCIFACLVDWGIENKISTITLDNASSNDSAVRHLKESFALKGNLLFNGRIFHVRCTAHILNLLVQDGLAVIESIIHNVRVVVKYLKMSPQRLHKFSEIVKNLQLPCSKRLVLDVPTRWNSTYSMHECALQFKNVFPMYKERDPYFKSLPTSEEWKVAENVMKFLEVFYEATMVFSSTEYPTSNMFLPEIWKIKELLNESLLDKSDYRQAMAHKMKDKFEKYWGNCNLLMSIASILDPRYKMHFVKFYFPKMYTTEFEANKNLTLVDNAIQELFDEYIAFFNAQQSATIIASSSTVVGAKGLTKNRNEFEAWAQSADLAQVEELETMMVKLNI
ncbi:zinc finger BED domain-containing protein RICESLEEPER 2-like [Heracleum sosnowskyi]|uniref:Zinc finger BED domain-containing protein RICESLEEPER 2-like n=1 Tax=Heracleum sosnowskyi TaxID=360622 RepID=A0AAD8NBX1_9APIA|nr:zinc finger BED domain-containing protein RICESLEEPER 2-like [Heracleum sosnowskyi]